jgi:hypothetical protein
MDEENLMKLIGELVAIEKREEYKNTVRSKRLSDPKRREMILDLVLRRAALHKKDDQD